LAVWEAFKVAGDTLWVTPGNKFSHSADRKSVTFEVHLNYSADGVVKIYRTPSEAAYLKGN
jgi:hypothetical protein